MLFFVKCQLNGNAETEIEMPKGKSITLGGGLAVDVRLTPYFQLPDNCARIWHDDHCLVENLTRKTSIVLLNGRPLHTVALFEKGDVLQIGVDQFKMTCREDEASSPPPPQTAKSADAPVTPQINYSLSSAVVSPVVTKYTPVDAGWKPADMLLQLFTQLPTILFANFRAAEMDPPAVSVAGSDLFETAPDEIREEHSLHAIINGTPRERMEWVNLLSDKDAIIVAIPAGDSQKCLANSRLFGGWFVRPSILEVTLTRGSRCLCEQLLRPFLGLVVPPAESVPKWQIYSSLKGSDEKQLLNGFKPLRR